MLFARGDTRNAFAALERSNQLNKKDAETFCEIGNAFVRQGNPDTALKAYEAARRENPKSLCGAVGPHHVKPSASKAQRPTPKEELIALQKSAFAVWDKALVEATLAEEGNVTYGFWASPSEPGVFRVYEEWSSPDAMGLHMASDHMATFLVGMGGLTVTGTELYQHEVAESSRLM